jgi:hypothetical protein
VDRWAWIDVNAADLGHALPDLDLDRVGVKDLAVMGAFDEFVPDPRSFHDPGIAAEDAGRVGTKGNLGEGLPVNFGSMVRGKSPRR